jgi:hypothetical protein
MSARPLEAPRFVRRTELGPGEYRRNFRQIDGDIISAVTSPEADRVTPLMSKIYLRLVHAPAQYRERDGVLRFEAELRDGTHVKAWDALCVALGVASATASKALRWMHEQGIIGYFAGKNGVGIRVFLNRAASSIGSRAAGKKILEFSPASSAGARTSRGEAAFSDSYAVSEVLETDLNPRAPKNGAEQTEVVKKYSQAHPPSICSGAQDVGVASVSPLRVALGLEVPVEEIVSRLRSDLEPSLQSAARQAAAREHERTREWLESRGLPKAARVAQRETYNVLRKYGIVTETKCVSQSDLGRGGYNSPEPHELSDAEVLELAQACLAMLEAHGQGIERTASEMSFEAGGFLLPGDVRKVWEKAEALLAISGENHGRRLN